MKYASRISLDEDLANNLHNAIVKYAADKSVSVVLGFMKIHAILLSDSNVAAFCSSISFLVYIILGISDKHSKGSDLDLDDINSLIDRLASQRPSRRTLSEVIGFILFCTSLGDIWSTSFYPMIANLILYANSVKEKLVLSSTMLAMSSVLDLKALISNEVCLILSKETENNDVRLLEKYYDILFITTPDSDLSIEFLLKGLRHRTWYYRDLYLNLLIRYYTLSPAKKLDSRVIDLCLELLESDHPTVQASCYQLLTLHPIESSILGLAEAIERNIVEERNSGVLVALLGLFIGRKDLLLGQSMRAKIPLLLYFEELDVRLAVIELWKDAYQMVLRGCDELLAYFDHEIIMHLVTDPSRLVRKSVAELLQLVCLSPYEDKDTQIYTLRVACDTLDLDKLLLECKPDHKYQDVLEMKQSVMAEVSDDEENNTMVCYDC